MTGKSSLGSRWFIGDSMKYSMKELNVSDIILDTDNPRIALAVENYKEDLNAEAIALALSSSGDSDSSGTTIYTLKESIRANGGIMQPIIVNHHDNKYTVIEGNTRVQIYKDYIRSNTKGNWTTIPAIVYEDMDEQTAHSIRLQAHLVGPRPWNPYSKAKYLTKLRDEDCMSMNDIINLCGGKRTEIQSLIEAYSDMEQYYHAVVDEDDFSPSQFSAFRELNVSNKRITALTDNGFTKADFGRWVIEGKIGKAENVRKLPDVLNDPSARKIFLSKDLTEAIASLRKESDNVDINLPLRIIADKVSTDLAALPWPELSKMKNGEDDGTLNSLRDLRDVLDGFFKTLSSE